MNLQIRNTNYRNDSILLGISDLKRLKTERPLVFTAGCEQQTLTGAEDTAPDHRWIVIDPPMRSL